MTVPVDAHDAARGTCCVRECEFDSAKREKQRKSRFVDFATQLICVFIERFKEFNYSFLSMLIQ